MILSLSPLRPIAVAPTEIVTNYRDYPKFFAAGRAVDVGPFGLEEGEVAHWQAPGGLQFSFEGTLLEGVEEVIKLCFLFNHFLAQDFKLL